MATFFPGNRYVSWSPLLVMLRIPVKVLCSTACLRVIKQNDFKHWSKHIKTYSCSNLWPFNIYLYCLYSLVAPSCAWGTSCWAGHPCPCPSNYQQRQRNAADRGTGLGDFRGAKLVKGLFLSEEFLIMHQEFIINSSISSSISSSSLNII